MIIAWRRWLEAIDAWYLILSSCQGTDVAPMEHLLL
jgi:hypothetical protein